jgi:hypothetical protein
MESFSKVVCDGGGDSLKSRLLTNYSEEIQARSRSSLVDRNVVATPSPRQRLKPSRPPLELSDDIIGIER